jgi:hypothetical protein
MISLYTATEFLNYLFKGIDADASDSRYIGLFDAVPNSTGSNEVTTDYFSDRVGIGGFAAAETVGSQLIKKNDSAFTFDTSSAASASPITHFGIFDASVGGNFLGGWEFVLPDRSTATSFSFGSGDSLNFAAEDLQIIFDLTNWTPATMTKLANWMCEVEDLGTDGGRMKYRLTKKGGYMADGGELSWQNISSLVSATVKRRSSNSNSKSLGKSISALSISSMSNTARFSL